MRADGAGAGPGKVSEHLCMRVRVCACRCVDLCMCVLGHGCVLIVGVVRAALVRSVCMRACVCKEGTYVHMGVHASVCT